MPLDKSIVLPSKIDISHWLQYNSFQGPVCNQQQLHLYQGQQKNQLKKNAKIVVLMNTSNALLLVQQVITIARLNAAVIISNVSILVIQEWVISSSQVKCWPIKVSSELKKFFRLQIGEFSYKAYLLKSLIPY